LSPGLWIRNVLMRTRSRIRIQLKILMRIRIQIRIRGGGGGGGRPAKNVHPPWQDPRYAPVSWCCVSYFSTVFCLCSLIRRSVVSDQLIDLIFFSSPFLFIFNQLKITTEHCNHCCGAAFRWCGSVSNPVFNLDADRDLYQSAATLAYYLPRLYILWASKGEPSLLRCEPSQLSAFHFDAHLDPAFHFDVHLDPAFHFDADPIVLWNRNRNFLAERNRNRMHFDSDSGPDLDPDPI
jgi:hypothetical protein